MQLHPDAAPARAVAFLGGCGDRRWGDVPLRIGLWRRGRFDGEEVEVQVGQMEGVQIGFVGEVADGLVVTFAHPH